MRALNIALQGQGEMLKECVLLAQEAGHHVTVIHPQALPWLPVGMSQVAQPQDAQNLNLDVLFVLDAKLDYWLAHTAPLLIFPMMSNLQLEQAVGQLRWFALDSDKTYLLWEAKLSLSDQLVMDNLPTIAESFSEILIDIARLDEGESVMASALSEVANTQTLLTTQNLLAELSAHGDHHDDVFSTYPEGWNQTDAPYPEDKTLHELFSEQASKTPDAVALVYEGETLTYQQLEEQSNQLAREILNQVQDDTSSLGHPGTSQCHSGTPECHPGLDPGSLSDATQVREGILNQVQDDTSSLGHSSTPECHPGLDPGSLSDATQVREGILNQVQDDKGVVQDDSIGAQGAPSSPKLVALCLDRSLEMVIAILGVLKAGYAYVPIDPDYPEERKQYILEDIGARVLVVDSRFRGNDEVECHPGTPECHPGLDPGSQSDATQVHEEVLNQVQDDTSSLGHPGTPECHPGLDPGSQSDATREPEEILNQVQDDTSSLGHPSTPNCHPGLDPGSQSDAARVPEEILNQVQDDRLGVQDDMLDGRHPRVGGDPVILSMDSPVWREHSTEPLPPQCTSQDLAYVIYTSGTTGRPKGVMVEHRSVVNLLVAVSHLYQWECNAGRSGAYTAYVFDVSVAEFFAPLLQGGEVHVFSNAVRYDVNALAHYVVLHHLEVVYLPPVVLSELPRENDYLELKRVIFAGEPCVAEVSDYWAQRVELLNYYGPTECTVYATGSAVEPGRHNIIGQPIANMQVYVLDADMQPVPAGVVGELYVGGVGLACGYLHRPELTAERFITNPFATEADQTKGYTRLYKTGDLVYWHPSGDLEYVGRSDFQVKIRGHRVELFSIDANLSGHPLVKEAVTIENKSGVGGRLISFVTLACDPKVETEYYKILRAYLAEILPDYMVPSKFLALEHFPLAPSGKIDRQALEELSVAKLLGTKIHKPTDSLEVAIYAAWTYIFQYDAISRDSDFYELGGDSLKATRLLMKLNQVAVDQGFAEVALGFVFKHRTIAHQAAALRTVKQDQSAVSLVAHPRRNQYPASRQQSRFFFINQLSDRGRHAYVMPVAFRLQGELSVQALETAINETVQRHEILSSRFLLDDAGVSFVYQPFEPVYLEIEALTHQSLQQRLRSLARTTFDLSTGYAYQFSLFKLADQQTFFLTFVHHHILADGWSLSLLFAEISNRYNHIIANEPLEVVRSPCTYGDFCLWEQAMLASNVRHAKQAFWQDYLNGYEALSLPNLSFGEEKDGSVVQALAPAVVEAIEKIRQQHELSVFQVLSAGLAMVLHAYSHQQDILFGVVSANRFQENMQHMIGPIINTLPLRIQLEGVDTVAEYLQAVGASSSAIYEHAEFPFDEIVALAAPGRAEAEQSLVNVLLVVQDRFQAGQVFALSGIHAESQPIRTGTLGMDLVVECGLSDAGIEISLQYSHQSFSEHSIRQFYQCLQQVFLSLADNLSQPMSALEYLSADQHQQIVYDWNQTDVAYPEDKTLHELFSEQASKTPDAVALVYEGEELTYQQLDEESNQLAREILNQVQDDTSSLGHPGTSQCHSGTPECHPGTPNCYSVTPECHPGLDPGSLSDATREPEEILNQVQDDSIGAQGAPSSPKLIALCLDRSLEMVVAILGVLKAGYAYVPIDPDYPEDRKQYILEDTGARVLVVDSRFRRNDSLSCHPGLDPGSLSDATQVHEEVLNQVQDDTSSLGHPGTPECHPGLDPGSQSDATRAPEEILNQVQDDSSSIRGPVVLSMDSPKWRKQSVEALPPQCTSQDLAYVIYTSGTTGRPKGVMVEHRDIGSFATASDFIDYSQVGVVAGLSNYAFDGSCFDLYVSLLNGATLALLPQAVMQDVPALIQSLNSHRVDTVFMTTALFNLIIIEDALSQVTTLKYVLFGGEPANQGSIEQALQRQTSIQFTHVYGPTETVVFATYCDLPSAQQPIVPIGSALRNKQCYVLDVNKQPVPIGAVGELYIGGAGLARGYLNRPELTAERFIANPFATEADAAKGYTRLYKTGDLVRWLPDGNLEYIGRNDFQVKLRGYRIELGEIEQALLTHPAVEQAVVLAKSREGTEGTDYLVGYVVLNHQVPEEILNRVQDDTSSLGHPGTPDCHSGTPDCHPGLDPGSLSDATQAPEEILNRVQDDTSSLGHPGTPHCHSGTPHCHPGLDPGSLSDAMRGREEILNRVQDDTASLGHPGTPDCHSGTPDCHPGLDPGSLSDATQVPEEILKQVQDDKGVVQDDSIGAQDPCSDMSVELQAHLSQQLPDYMVPSTFVVLDKLPLTTNGKLDRKALPEPTFTETSDYVAPRTEIEQQLCEIWQEVLGLDQVGIEDDFFRLGGSSIVAMSLAHRMSAVLGRHIGVAAVFEHRTIQALVENAQLIQIDIPVFSQDRPRLSFAQERLWFIEQFNQGVHAYHIPFALKLSASIDAELLKASVCKLVERHEVLRTVIAQDDAGYFQRVTDQVLTISDQPIKAAELDAFTHRFIHQEFDLMHELPMRATLIHSGKQRQLLLVIHHIAFDGWSLSVFLKELSECYQGLSKGMPSNLPSLPIQYRDYAEWQRGYLTGPVLERQLAYWQEALSGVAALPLPADYLRPKVFDHQGRHQSFTLSESLSERLKQFAQLQGVGLYSVLLTAFKLMLATCGGETDIAVGTPSANRDYLGTQDVVGFFVNTLVVRTDLSQVEEMSGLVTLVHRQLTQAQANQDLPFEKLVESLAIERDSSRHPLCQVMFAVQDFGQEKLCRGLKPVQPDVLLANYRVAKFDLECFIDPSAKEISGTLVYASSIYAPDTVQRWIETYVHILEQLDRVSALRGLAYLPASQYQQIVYDWNQTDVAYPEDKTLHELFSEQASKTPDAVALVYEGETLTYQQLEEQSNQLAREILNQVQDDTSSLGHPGTSQCHSGTPECHPGLDPGSLSDAAQVREGILNQVQDDSIGVQDDSIGAQGAPSSPKLVALCLDRSLEMVVAILGALKAGYAYVPIDPDYPEDRKQYILEDTGAQVLVVDSRFRGNDEVSSHPGTPQCPPGTPNCHPGLDPGSLSDATREPEEILNQVQDDSSSLGHPGTSQCHSGTPECHPGTPNCHPGLDPGSLSDATREHEGILNQVQDDSSSIRGPVVLSMGSPKWREQSTEPLSPQCTSQDLAYVIYTSGTTGRPKGVMVAHRSVVNMVSFQIEDFSLTNQDHGLIVSNYIFDAFVFELFPQLLSGSVSYVIARSVLQSQELLSAYLNQHAISKLFCPTVLLPQVIPVLKGTRVRLLHTGGEALSPVRMPEGCRFVNQYGPTEATVFATQKEVVSGEEGAIGRAIANTRLYILDARQQPVPIGAVGELYIGGAGLARGYLHRPELTAERFVANPFATEADQACGYTRLYKTGDLVRWLPDGNLEYIGRNDFQVKLRGYRIELGEIEQALLTHPAVEQAVVLPQSREGSEGTDYLVGYVVLNHQVPEEILNRVQDDTASLGHPGTPNCHSGTPHCHPGLDPGSLSDATRGREEILNQVQDDKGVVQDDNIGAQDPAPDMSAELQAHLSQQLPDYMVPSTFVVLDKLPLTTNGKLDRKALPEPTLTDTSSYVAPRTETEQQLCEIWQEVLGLGQVGIKDDFFRLGGNSILCMSVASAIQQIFKQSVQLADLYQHTTVEAQAELLASEASAWQAPYIHLNQSQADQVMLFAHPYAAGSEIYRPIAQRLASRYQCVGLQPLALWSEGHVEDFMTMAEAYVDVLPKALWQRRICIAGWSSGGLLAVALASVLEQRGIVCDHVYLLDPSFVDADAKSKIQQWITDQDWFAPYGADHRYYAHLSDALQVRFVAQFKMTLAAMRDLSGFAYTGEATIYCATQDKSKAMQKAYQAHWQRQLMGAEIVWIDTDHQGVLSEKTMLDN